MLTRIYAISDPGETTDPDYVVGLRAAVGAAVDYGLAVIDLGEERAPSPPPALLAQARMAARNGIGLDTVLRRYCAGNALLVDFVVEEGERAGLHGVALQRLLRAQVAVLDRLLAAVSEEHTREARVPRFTGEERRSDRIRRLLTGELLDTADLAYDFEVCHLGIVASGLAASDVLRELAGLLDRRLLAVRHEGDAVWAWIGGGRDVDATELERLLATELPPAVFLAVGEPARGLGGWRLTHHQARAALPIARRSPRAVVRYADVALLASAFRDDLLASSLRELYLAPLETERSDAGTLRGTLRAYFAADRNVSSAAATLGVNRNTVASRLRAVEEAIGRPIATFATCIDVALSLEELAQGEPSYRAHG